ncbi:hypothetical protein [Actinorugispora endophytica]|uniref:4-amino-4-deoxy-L-arabinose transferase-like glycosyltransferase n=1 Tax=Actinorugispora endophytica TaxID=1605990 RepID=A0A4R6V0T3_9ACTN|nr:hypothetical protein [Actinorugispora endophytica]TDQ51555.1 hypothetical protein EV190_11043 [Actinorugispora endophytica]
MDARRAGEAEPASAGACPAARNRRAGRGGAAALGAVCAAFAAAGLLLVPIGLGLGWDEVVYVSQYDPRNPAAFFSAPRSRGVSLLAAPVVLATGSVPVLRAWLACAAALAMLAGFWPWLRLWPTPVVAPLAALGYATLWVSLFYTASAMPNHYTAMAAVGAVGWFLAAARGRGPRGALAALGAMLVVAGLMRPSDAFWLAAPLGAAALAVPAWRRPGLVAAVAVGALAGVAPWLVEAQAVYGGVLERLVRAGEIQGGTEPTFALAHSVATLDGPLLCRPCDGDAVRWPALLWWAALVPLVALGVASARRARRAAGLLPVAVAASMSFTYLFLIDYSAPRFLLPVYALLAVPAAAGTVRLWSAANRRTRPALGAGLAVALAGHLLIQGVIVTHWAASHTAARQEYARLADALHGAGLRPPCLLTGDEAVPIAYYAGCASAAPSGSNATHSLDGLLTLGRTVPFGLLDRGGSPPDWAADWRALPVGPAPDPRAWVLYVPEWSPVAD